MASSPKCADSDKVHESITAKVMPVLFAFLLFLFAYDLSYNRLGPSNGKFISFVDTCLNVFNYRNGCTNKDRTRVGSRQAVQILISSFIIKFASGVVVSILLDKVPVVFTGWRHSLSFFVGFAMLWLAPGDFIFIYMQRSRAVRVFLGIGGGLYKMRKALFAVEAATQGGGGLGFALLVAVVAVDGNTLTRRGVQWLETHMNLSKLDTQSSQRLRRRSSQRIPHSGSIGGGMTFRMLTHDTSYGLWKTLLGSILPLGIITFCIWIASQKSAAIGEDKDKLNIQYVDPSWAGAFTDDDTLSLRAALLAVFIWRADTFHELARIHTESLIVADIMTKANKWE